MKEKVNIEFHHFVLSDFDQCCVNLEVGVSFIE